MNRKRALNQFTACLGGRVPASADWRAIVSLANEHLVTPALFEGIDANAQASRPVPAEVQTFLADVHHRSRARNQALSRTLRDALQALNGVGIEPVLLKGCALWNTASAAVAAGPKARIVCDLDLFVRPAELEQALAALVAHGFAIVEDQRARTYHPVVELARPADPGSIDLHQHAPGAAHMNVVDEFHDHCRNVEVDGMRAMLPAPELQILMIVLHDQLLDGHYWRGGFHLRHLLDIAVLTRCRPDIDWHALVRMCPSSLVHSALKAELLAARRIAGARIPNWIVDDIWTRLNFARHRVFFERPTIGAFLRSIGLNARIWRALSS